MISLRPYQAESVDAVFRYWQQGGGNPLVDLATGLGKSVVIASLTQQVLSRWPDMRVIVAVHVRELVEQNFMAMVRLWPEAGGMIGINSAGLGRRDRRSQILFASIQSIFRDDHFSLGQRDLVLIDEAHLVPKSGDGMYRTFIDRLRAQTPDLRVAGFTATPFRLDSGRLDQGNDRLFDEIVYSYDIGAGIRDGWLSPLISKASAIEIDVSGVGKRGGEFIPGALEAAADKADLTATAASEIVGFGANRRSWLIFCSGVEHAYHVRDAIRTRGVHAETVTGETPAAERAGLIRQFREGKLRCLTNAQVLTTGFDAPGTDMIVFLRPTLSTGLYLQMVGRGVRKADGKGDCLVLDFAGNVRRHGPVDAVTPPPERRRGALSMDEEVKVTVDTVRAKTCPDCEALVGLAAIACPSCGYKWPIKEPKHEATADGETPILSTERPNLPELVPVVSWEASRHRKFGSPDSLRVTYRAGLLSYSEWVCLEHSAHARAKAERWWRQHGGGDAPATVDEGLDRFADLAMPSHIAVRKATNGKWFDVVSRQFPKKEDQAA